MGTNWGIGVAERGGGGISTLSLSCCEFRAFCVLGIVDRRTVICFGSCGIGILGFGISDAIGAAECSESSGSGFIGCVCKCSWYNDSTIKDFAHTPHCHFGCLVFDAAVGDGATGICLKNFICFLRLVSIGKPLSQIGQTCIRAFGVRSIFARLPFALAGARRASGFGFRLRCAWFLCLFMFAGWVKRFLHIGHDTTAFGTTAGFVTTVAFNFFRATFFDTTTLGCAVLIEGTTTGSTFGHTMAVIGCTPCTLIECAVRSSIF